MTRFIFILSVMFAFTVNTNAQVTLNEVTMPAKISFDNQNLVLNGAGVRTKLFFKLYTIGLYVSNRSTDGNAILKADEILAVRFEITSDMINSDNMSEAINEGFDASTDGNTTAIRSRIDEVLKTFSSEAIEPGDVFDLVYIPGVGTKIFKNEKLKSTVKGLDFKTALFGIWISDNPVSGGLKKDLLGEVGFKEI